MSTHSLTSPRAQVSDHLAPLGVIEQRIADLLAAPRDRALSLDDIVNHAFQLQGETPTPVQRRVAAQTTLRVLKRYRDLHPPDVPVRVWAVSISAGGITWAEVEVTKVTERNVVVRYAGEVARLNRYRLWRCWEDFWRRVRFVSSRTGRTADKLDKLWQQRYGASGDVPPSITGAKP